MKCPNCDFIEKDEAFGDPATCPKCGAIYEKALKIRADKDRHELFEKKRLEATRSNQDNAPSIKSRLASASASVSEGREERAQAEIQKHKQRESRSVIVTDIDMPFWSMVNFMIKWALASVPALFILALIMVGAASILRILFS